MSRRQSCAKEHWLYTESTRKFPSQCHGGHFPSICWMILASSLHLKRQCSNYSSRFYKQLSHLAIVLTSRGARGCFLGLAQYYSIHYRVVFNLTSRGARGCFLGPAQYYRIHLYRVEFNLTSREATSCLLLLAQYYSIHLYRVVLNLTSRESKGCQF